MASKKSLLSAFFIIVVLVVAFLLYNFWQQQNQLLGNDITLTLFTKNNQPNGKGMLALPFLRTSSESLYVNVGLDWSNDGTIGDVSGGTTQQEWIVKNVRARPGKNWNNNFYFGVAKGADVKNAKNIRVVLTGQPIMTAWDGTLPGRGIFQEKSVLFTQQELPDFVQLATVTKPEESMKGGEVAFAQGSSAGVPDTFKNDVPDIAQRPGECAPTSAANSIIRLAGDNNRIDAIPRDPYELIDSLKGEMQWTYQDGVLPDNFVKGKDAMAAKLGLPIHTETVGDMKGFGTLTGLENALGKDGAAEVRLKFTAPGATKAVGGHMVTVTGVYSEGRRDFINMHDPLSASGTDTYEVVDGKLVNYPYHDGDIYLSVGFVQYWQPGLSGTSMQPLTEEERAGMENATGTKRTIKVIVVNGHKIPLSLVHVGKGPECLDGAAQAPHYHANKDEKSTALDGTVMPDPGGCGYGKVKDIPVEDATP